MPVLVTALYKPSVEAFKKRVEERRAVLESSRSMNVKRLQMDVQRMAKKEIEFVQKVVEDVVPVRVVWNDEAWDRLKAFLPVVLEPKTPSASPTDAPAAAGPSSPLPEQPPKDLY